MKIDVSVERDDRVQRCSSEERYEIPADGKQDKDYVDCHFSHICALTYCEGLELRLLRSLSISLCDIKVVITYRMTSRMFLLRY